MSGRGRSGAETWLQQQQRQQRSPPRPAGLFYAETSAKADNNVEQLFVEVAKRVPKTGAHVRKDVVNVKAPVPQATAKKGGCC